MAFVEQLQDKIRARLVVVSEVHGLVDAIQLLHAGTDMIIVCDKAGALSGVLTKTDVVQFLANHEHLGRETQVASAMERNVLTCTAEDELHAICKRMRDRDFKNVPVLDSAGKPIGILTARDALALLLEETEDAESLLRDYVMGVGYR